MKYCSNCGSQIDDKAVICVHCGCATDTAATATAATSDTSSTLKTIAKIFMILGCIAYGWCLIPLCWTIPMTVHYFNSVKNNQPVGLGFKVCSLLFVNLVAGILMLCDNEQN